MDSDSEDFDDYCTYQNCLINKIDGIFLSDWEAAAKLDILEELGIKKVISLGNREELEKYVYHEGIEYLKIEIEDEENENISQHFEITNKFIDNETLVHCHKGISRSVTIVMAYLMSKNMSYLSAFYKIKAVRPFINPNIGFMDQLSKYYT